MDATFIEHIIDFLQYLSELVQSAVVLYFCYHWIKRKHIVWEKDK